MAAARSQGARPGRAGGPVARLRAKAGDLIAAVLYRNAALFRLRMNLYPPYLGAGIHVTRVSRDFRDVVVELRDRRANMNAFGTHFGGSLYAMVDPFYCLMVYANLGPGYVVWDQAAQITFLRPGTGTVRARFTLDEADLDAARRATADGAKYLPVFHCEVLDASDTVVARVEKTLYIRRKPQRRPKPDAAAG